MDILYLLLDDKFSENLLESIQNRKLTRGGFSSTFFTNIQTQIQTAIQNFINQLLTALGLGRSLTPETRQLLGNIFIQLGLFRCKTSRLVLEVE